MAIIGVAVVDVASGTIVPEQTVLIAGGVIEALAPADVAVVPAGARVIDGRGLYVMPGLVDAHAHYFERETFGRLYVASGVTLVRDMGMANELIFPLRAEIAGGSALGPEVLTAGAILDGAPPLIPLISRGVATPDEARQAVRDQVAAGSDFIKVYSTLAADVFAAIVDEAHALGLKVAGHVPDSVPIEEAAIAGLDSVEHFFGFDKLVGRLLGAPVRQAYAGMGADAGFFARLGELDPADLSRALASLRASGLAVCPTLVTFKVGVQTKLYQSGTFSGSDLVSGELLGMWRSLWAGQDDLEAYIWERWAKFVVALHDAGVPLMVGTDLSVPGVCPGLSVHDEMAIWQDAGIPAPDVLRSATLVPVRWLGLGDRLGTVTAGKTASLVLVRANPLDDVRHAQEIEGVFLQGRYFDRAALDLLLAEVRRAARP